MWLIADAPIFTAADWSWYSTAAPAMWITGIDRFSSSIIDSGATPTSSTWDRWSLRRQQQPMIIIVIRHNNPPTPPTTAAIVIILLLRPKEYVSDKIINQSGTDSYTVRTSQDEQNHPLDQYRWHVSRLTIRVDRRLRGKGCRAHSGRNICNN